MTNRTLLLLAVGLATAVICGGLQLSKRALAHGDAMWIQEGNYKDEDGIHCCGPTDCKAEEARFFRESPLGIFVKTTGGEEILMPRKLVGRGLYPSKDDSWWICVRAGSVRCVFKPTTGT